MTNFLIYISFSSDILMHDFNKRVKPNKIPAMRPEVRIGPQAPPEQHIDELAIGLGQILLALIGLKRAELEDEAAYGPDIGLGPVGRAF
jgi:hypothetical protein